jgi:site-specific recombinase XerD
MKISNLITDFLEYCELEKGHSDLTIRNYDHYLRRFLDFVGDIGPGDIALELVRNYRLFLNRFKDEHGQPLEKITQNYHIIALRAFLKYLAKRDIKSLPTEKVELADVKRKTIEFLELEELERLFEATNQEKEEFIKLRNRAILETLFSTGLRVSELTKLSCNKINLKREEFSVQGKGGKTRVVFLSDSAKYWLERYLEKRTDNFEPLFIRMVKNVKDITEGEKLRLTPRSIQRLIQKYAKIAGILDKKVTPHTLRHTYATDLLMSGADIRSVQTMLGHSSITTTQIYTHITDKQLREVHKAFHGKRRRK